jgi:multiple sugar transport system permease protein
MSKIATRKRWIGILYLLPCGLVIGCLLFYPLIYSVFLSFHRQALYDLSGTFCGLENYIKLLGSTRFWESLRKTLVWTVGTLSTQVAVGVVFALLLNNEFKGRPFAISSILLPFFIPVISGCLVFRWMFNDINGLFNYILMSLRLIDTPILWLSKPTTAMFAVIMASFWIYCPFVVINVLARLETVPQELYDAASIDGAGALASFRFITLPQIRGVVLIVVLLRWIFMFNKFDAIWIMTQGGPVGATETLAVLAYRTGFRTMQMGEASAITTMLLLILVVIMGVYIGAFKPTKVTN